jgi:large subunit ribosomal protein L21
MENNSYVIAEIAGRQVVLEPGKTASVPKLDLEIGSSLSIDKVLYLRQGDQVKVGTPYVKNVAVSTIVKDHLRSDKVIVFKKKRRKGYKVKKGHRQPYTLLEVQEVKESKKSKKASASCDTDIPEESRSQEILKDREEKSAKPTENKD